MKTFFDACVQKASALIQKAFEQKNISEKSITPKIILGLSGGPDSVFLLYVLNELQKQKRIALLAVHLDHQWRQESGQDVEFCAQLCGRLEIDFMAYKAQDLDFKFKCNGSKEELGRKMRRLVFQQALNEMQGDFIALAHHLQDQQETFFLRLLRGASLSGLCCMKEIDGLYIRPLLGVNKKEILEYLDSNCHPEPCPELVSGSMIKSSSLVKYLIDPTNVSQNYLRNRIRSNVIPALEQADVRFNDKFQSTLEQLTLEDDFLEMLVAQEFARIFEYDVSTMAWHGGLNMFRQLHPVIARRVTLHWLIQEKKSFSISTNYLNEIIKFLCSPHGGSHQVGVKWKIYKKQNSFWIGDC